MTRAHPFFYSRETGRCWAWHCGLPHLHDNDTVLVTRERQRKIGARVRIWTSSIATPLSKRERVRTETIIASQVKGECVQETEHRLDGNTVAVCFLAVRSDRFQERMRAAHYEQQLYVLTAELQRGNVSKVSMQILKTTKKGFLVKEDPSSIYERYTPARIQPVGC